MEQTIINGLWLDKHQQKNPTFVGGGAWSVLLGAIAKMIPLKSSKQGLILSLDLLFFSLKMLN